MLANQYDGEVTTWSPQGRLHQIEYAMEAVKQGSACVGVKSGKFAVICTLKRTPSKLANYQKKVYKVDDHIGIAIAGLTPDARVLSRYMRQECLNHKFVYDTPMNTGRLVLKVADKHQKNTQRYGRRPYGVGLLVVGYDQTGAHLYETCPSGNYYDYKAIAIGSRSQSAKTYLERLFDEESKTYKCQNASLDELIKHGLTALSETLGSAGGGTTADDKLTNQNTSVGIVGEGRSFEILEGASLTPYLDALEREGGGTQSHAESGNAGGSSSGSDAMDI